MAKEKIEPFEGLVLRNILISVKKDSEGFREGKNSSVFLSFKQANKMVKFENDQDGKFRDVWTISLD